MAGKGPLTRIPAKWICRPLHKHSALVSVNAPWPLSSPPPPEGSCDYTWYNQQHPFQVRLDMFGWQDNSADEPPEDRCLNVVLRLPPSFVLG